MEQKHFTAIIEGEGDWFVAHCLEIPGATGQGPTAEAARKSLAEAITMVLEDRLEDELEEIEEQLMAKADEGTVH